MDLVAGQTDYCRFWSLSRKPVATSAQVCFHAVGQSFRRRTDGESRSLSVLCRGMCETEILTVNLDPVGRQFRSKGYPEKVPLPDHSVQLVFALEIIEHLTSPFHLLAEAHRILASGGHIVLTTPNVTRIGNIFKLLIGRTPNDRLAPPGYDNPDDEWRPHAREYAMHELADMLRQTGFRHCRIAVLSGRGYTGVSTVCPATWD